MTLGQLLKVFLQDDKLIVVFVVLILDFVFGVLAALKVGNFRFAYVSDFLRNDVLFKVVPYFVLYSGAVVAGQTDIIIPGLDLGVIAGAAYATLVAALVASILSSLNTLKEAPTGRQSLKTALAAPENASPPKE